ncbi:hypothetical protein Droror1_Dr00027736 [Drosera rotundifolia]
MSSVSSLSPATNSPVRLSSSSPPSVQGESLNRAAAAFLLGSSLADALIARVPSKTVREFAGELDGNSFVWSWLALWKETVAIEAGRTT